jgi:hypothetical protein
MMDFDSAEAAVSGMTEEENATNNHHETSAAEENNKTTTVAITDAPSSSIASSSSSSSSSPPFIWAQHQPDFYLGTASTRCHRVAYPSNTHQQMTNNKTRSGASVQAEGSGSSAPAAALLLPWNDSSCEAVVDKVWTDANGFAGSYRGTQISELSTKLPANCTPCDN